jgi:hypothetical protein
MDVGDWLRRLGLEQYEASFRENRIDDTVLPRLTAEDLKDLGVGFVGHRRKLLDAIAALRARVRRTNAAVIRCATGKYGLCTGVVRSLASASARVYRHREILRA